ncbi:MAG: hypothetical protein ACEPOW_09455 [Bacteroidales bacterium]
MNTKNILISISWILLLSSGIINNNKKPLTKWETIISKNGIKIEYRWIIYKDSIKTRENKSVFHVKAPIKIILQQFKSSNKLKKWSTGIKACKVFEDKGDEWYTYFRYKIPWPLEQQDLVSIVKRYKTENSTILHMISTPKKIPFVKNIKRLKNTETIWILKPISKNITSIEVRSISVNDPLIPRFFQDKIVFNLLIDSFLNLKKMAEEQKTPMLID